MDYQNLWDTMVINQDRVSELKNTISQILKNKQRYADVATGMNNHMPWFFIAAIHYREADLDFTCNLANGDPLTARTINEPKGRPLSGKPPFTWEFAAVDALNERNLSKVTTWDMPTILSELEKYNGTGYMTYYPSVLTPYLWAASNHYTAGKYASDGHFNAILIDKQLGAAPLIRYLTDKTLQ